MKATAQHHSRNRRAGFTLVELMIVVAILGILASIALPLFKHYIYKARAGEATFTLAQIRAVEEEFRTDNGSYFNLSTSENVWFPASTVSPTQREYRWEASTEFDNWKQYGLVPPSRSSRFQYQVLAGTPENVSGFAASRGYTDGADHWFIARAHADLDGDSIEEGEEGYVTFEIYNLTDGIYINRDKGWE